tara:strand:+ start:480 stop:752 length:273 start_codon:yes stop_codon:yes gene_type:complete
LANEEKRRPKVYAYRDDKKSAYVSPWVKIVVSVPPKEDDYPVSSSARTIGPFRTEVDCEDFCDRANLAFCGEPQIKFYEPIKRAEQNSEA